jgi:hypothetical protein
MTTDSEGASSGSDLTDEIQYLSRSEVDSRRILVQLVPNQLESPVEVWTAELSEETSGDQIPLDLMAEIELALRAGEAPAPHVISSRRTYMDWGASAVGEDILLEVASWALSGVAGSIAYDALRRTVAKLVRTSREGSNYPPRERMSGEEAAERGRWSVRSAFNLSEADVEQLVVSGEEVASDGSRTVRYTLGARRFEVELVEADGLIEIVRVGWGREGSESTSPDR